MLSKHRQQKQIKLKSFHSSRLGLLLQYHPVKLQVL